MRPFALTILISLMIAPKNITRPFTIVRRLIIQNPALEEIHGCCPDG
jgi:hypothetical protein